MPKQKQPSLVKTFRQETKGSKVSATALLLFSILGIGFEIGPGNEWLVALAGKLTLDNSPVDNIALTGLTVGASLFLVSLAEHLLLGGAMYLNLQRFPKTIGKIRDTRFGKSNVLRNSQQRNLLEKFGNAFSIGAATVNLEDSVTDQQFVTKSKGLKRTIQSALLIASGSFIIGISAGSGMAYALNEGNHVLAENILRWIANPLLWAILFIIVRVRDYVANRMA